MGDTASDKRVLTAHSVEYNPDSVLLHSLYNDELIAGASYLIVVAHHTWDMESNLTFWLYSLPLE